MNVDEIALKTAQDIADINPDRLRGGVSQAIAMAQVMILEAIESSNHQRSYADMMASFMNNREKITTRCVEVNDKLIDIYSDIGADDYMFCNYCGVVPSDLFLDVNYNEITISYVDHEGDETSWFIDISCLDMTDEELVEYARGRFREELIRRDQHLTFKIDSSSKELEFIRELL